MSYNVTYVPSLIPNIANTMQLGDWTWAVAAIITLVCAFIVSRNGRQIRILLLPIAISWQTIGIRQNLLFITGISILFAYETLSFSAIGELITTIGSIPQRISTFTDNRQLQFESHVTNLKPYSKKKNKKFTPIKEAIPQHIDNKWKKGSLYIKNKIGEPLDK